MPGCVGGGGGSLILENNMATQESNSCGPSIPSF